MLIDRKNYPPEEHSDDAKREPEAPVESLERCPNCGAKSSIPAAGGFLKRLMCTQCGNYWVAASWQSITPKDLVRAVESSWDKFGRVICEHAHTTSKACFRNLNPVPRLPGEALPDLPTWSQLYELYKTSGLEQLLKLEIEDAFHDFCQFAREHSVSLILPPVEWAKTHAWLLIEQKLQPKAWAIEALGLQPDQPGIEQPLNRFAREVISFWQLHIHMMAHEAEVERAKNSKATVQATTSPVETSPLAVALPSDKMSIANNIEKLRKECGWGADSLADKTRIAKTTVLSHLKGRAKPQLQTLVKYAQAFSKALGRHITASDLEK